MSKRNRWLIIAGVAMCAIGGGCRSAAAVFLDIPEPADKDDLAVAAVTPTVASEDTIRPPIESVASPDSVLTLLPKALDGAIDWARAAKEGVIAPRPAPGGQESSDALGGFAYDFFFGDFETLFPHSAHVAVMSCESCHPAIYRQRGSKTSMSEIMSGGSCGQCHGTVAFTVNACERCHPSSSMPEGRLKAELKDDIVMNRDTSTANASMMTDLSLGVLPHWIHRLRFRCDACHPTPFEMRTREKPITMADMDGGRTCGKCHDGIAAFSLMECGRCHREPITVPAPED